MLVTTIALSNRNLSTDLGTDVHTSTDLHPATALYPHPHCSANSTTDDNSHAISYHDTHPAHCHLHTCRPHGRSPLAAAPGL